MFLADKIINLRKKAGWSQEELAEKLAVTRQSVSKWEGAQSIPDMDKVVQMSRLFGVTTDYLLKDEIEMAEPTVNADDRQPPLRRVTIGEASDYLALRRTAAPKMALATMLCIFSPIALIGLAAVSELSASAFPLREETAAGIGLCVLMILAAIAVTLFLSCGNKAKEYDFLEKEPFETEYGVTGMVKERQKAFKPTYDRMNTIGTVLCVLSFVPLFAVIAVIQDGFFMTMAVCLLLAVCLSGSDLMYIGAVCLLLGFVALACLAFVYAGTRTGAMEKLLEEGDYTRREKSQKNITGPVSVIYWLVATAIFMIYTFGPKGNGQPRYSWIIWAVAGVLYAAVLAGIKLIRNRK